MALERRSPLPRGIYWLDIIGPVKQGIFLKWRAENKSRVTVRKTTEDRERGLLWLLFEVKEPVGGWPATELGFPNIAEQGLKTEHVPGFEPTPDLIDTIADKLPKPETFVTLLWFGAIAAGIYAAAQFMKAAKNDS